MNILSLTFTIVIYLSIIGYLGYKGFRSTKNSEDYMLGGRKMHPFVMAMSYGATFISTAAIVGFGGTASLFGMSLLWLVVANIAVGVLIAFVFVGKRTRKMGLNLGAHTFPEFLGKRLNSPFIQRFMGVVIFLFMPLYASAVLIGASRIMEGLLGLSYNWSLVIFSLLVAIYVIFGGLKGVMYTDTLQGTLMFAGMIILLVTVYKNLGGVTEAHNSLAAMKSLVPENLKAMGHNGWTSSPKTGTPLSWIIYSSLVFGVGIGVLAQPQLVVRYMSVNSDKELNRAVIIGALFIMVTVGTSFIAGALSNVFYYESQSLISIEAAGGNSDLVIPGFIRDFMPEWYGYIFMLIILSAGMSTLSSQFHTVGTSIGRDFYSSVSKTTSEEKREKNEMLVTRAGTFISIAAALIIALNTQGGFIARATAIFFGLMASAFLAPYIASLYWKKLTKKGAIAGILTGFTAAVFCFLFIHTSEAKVFGIVSLLTNGKQAALIPGIVEFIDPLVIALPLSVITTITVSLFTKEENSETTSLSFKDIA